MVELYPVFGVGLALLITSGAGIYAWKKKQQVREMYREVATKRGWRFELGGHLSKGDAVRGAHQGLDVSIEPHVVSTGKSSVRYTRYVVRGLSPALWLKHRGLGQQLWGMVAGDGVRTGDAHFDEHVRMEGDPVVCLAVLGLPERDYLAALITPERLGVSTWLEDGTLIHQVQGYPQSVYDIENRLNRVLGAAAMLRATPGLAQLAGRARTDPNPMVRLRALEVLLSRTPQDHHAAILQPLLDDPVAMIRRAAAIRLGDAAALHADILRNPPDTVEAWTSFAAALQRFGAPLRGDEKLESLLIRGLADPDGAVVQAAAEGLAVIGTVRAIPALTTHQEGVLNVGPVANAAREALRQIDARLDPNIAGSLALPAQADGAVRIAAKDHQ